MILPLAGFYVSEGEFVFSLAVLAATIGSLLGALVLYAVSRHGGRPLLLRHRRLLRMRESDLDRADAWFDRHGAWLVLGGRFVPGARSVVSVPAGLSEMPLGRFVALTTLGSAGWNVALIGAGWALGSNYDRVADAVGPVSTAVTVALAVGLVAAAVWWYRRSRSKR